MQTTTEAPARVAGAIMSGLAIQQRERETTLQSLRRLRKEASAEIERLIAFLDASDVYVITELEDAVDDHPCDWDELEEDPADDEPSLGFLERHPSLYGFAERHSTGHQLAACDGLHDDLEDEHDGGEPGEDDEPSLGWTTGGQLGAMSDNELDDCDRESNEPLLTECV